VGALKAMLGTLLVVALVVAIGSRAGDNLRVRQQEIILHKLPEAQAVAYYDVLRRRMRKVVILRAVAVTAVILLFYSYKYRLTSKLDARPVKPVPAQTDTSR
jgi:hypothetical protein